MERNPHQILPQANLTQHTPQQQDTNSHLDSVLEQAKDQLQLQMLLIEVASCDDNADFALIALHFCQVFEKLWRNERHHGIPCNLLL